MKRFELLVLGGLAGGTVAGCGGGAKREPPAPQANADSAAAERARQDSIERARQGELARQREEADRIARQRAADPLPPMGRTPQAGETAPRTMTPFDFDKSKNPPGNIPDPPPRVAIP